jgi:hypothetical protein
MDATPEHFAYLCLPIVAGNTMGWELLCPSRVDAEWNGEDGQGALRIMSGDRKQQNVISHFGSGILTFAINYIFRTPPGYSLYVKGPTNHFKDGVCPIEAIVETDWLPNIFTMNYKFTRPNCPVRFEAGEPFCCIFPISRDYALALNPTIKTLEHNPQLAAEFEAWRRCRKEDKTGRYKLGLSDRRKDYRNGRTALGTPAVNHQRVVRLKPFRDLRETSQQSKKEGNRISGCSWSGRTDDNANRSGKIGTSKR